MSNQGFGGDDDKDKNDIERLLDGLSSAKNWYEKNKDLFDRFKSQGSSVSLDSGEPISEAHVDEDKVLIVADVTGVNATNLSLEFFDDKIEGTFGDREFVVDVPADVDEDTIEADMKNGVLRVEIEREDVDDDDITVDSIDHTDDTIGVGESFDEDDIDADDGPVDLDNVFDAADDIDYDSEEDN